MDTTIFIPKENTDLFIPIKRAEFKSYIKPKVYTQKKGRARVTVKLDSTGITATSSCDSIAKTISFYKKQVTESRQEVNDLKTTVTKKTGYSRLELILYMIASSIFSFLASYFIKKR